MYRDEDYDVFAEKMHEKYPLIFNQKYGGFCIGSGWWPIIESLCYNIQNHIDWKEKQGNFIAQVTVSQIKEKFGGLRFYYDGGDDVVDGMVRMAESWASQVCEECGKPGKSRNSGWIKTLCDDHEAERQMKYERYAKDNGFEL